MRGFGVRPIAPEAIISWIREFCQCTITSPPAWSTKSKEEERPDYEEASKHMIGQCMMETELLYGDLGGYCFHHFYPFTCKEWCRARQYHTYFVAWANRSQKVSRSTMYLVPLKNGINYMRFMLLRGQKREFVKKLILYLLLSFRKLMSIYYIYGKRIYPITHRLFGGRRCLSRDILPFLCVWVPGFPSWGADP